MKVVAKILTYPTPLRRTSKNHHVSSAENASFDPSPVTPCSTGTKEPHCILVCQHLTFSSSEEDDDDTPTDEIPSPDSPQPMQYHIDTLQWWSSTCTLNAHVTLEAEEEEEEDFQTVPLDDEHWDMEELPDRPFMYSWTFLATWTMPLPVSIFGLPDNIILWYIGFKQHLLSLKIWWPHPVMKTSLHSMILDTENTVVRNEHLYSYEL